MLGIASSPGKVLARGRGALCIFWKQQMLPRTAAMATRPALGHAQPLEKVFTFWSTTSIMPRFLYEQAGVLFKLVY